MALDPHGEIASGDRATLWFEPEALNLFAPESGENLTVGIG